MTRRLCNVPGCPGIAVDAPRCEKHTIDRKRVDDKARRSSEGVIERRRVYASPRWKGKRRTVLKRAGRRCECVRPECPHPGGPGPARCMGVSQLQVDHIIPIADAPDRVFDVTNLQVLCLSPCHSRKTAADIAARS